MDPPHSHNTTMTSKSVPASSNNNKPATSPLLVQLTHAPKLIRTESIEQSALSAYFKHTHIDLSSPASPRLTTEDLLIHHSRKSQDDFDFHSLLPQDCELNADLDQELDAYYFDALPSSELNIIE